MESITSDAHIHVEPGPSSLLPVEAPAPLNIRWGRTTCALIGVLALITAGISGALSVFSLGSSAWFWSGLSVFAAVVVLLRTLAVREQSARRAARQAERATADAAAAESSAADVVARETALFDRAESDEAEPAQKPLTAEELRAVALRVAAKGTADAKLAHTLTLAEGELGLEPWEPVDIPVPGYVKAAKALSLEKPLVLPAAPKSEGTSIKADQAGVGVAGAEGQEGVALVVSSPVESAGKPGAAGKTASVRGAKPLAPERGHALHNLDDVLQRRRA